MKGNDELLGFHIFKVFNTMYQRNEANIVYSNFIEYHQDYKQTLKGSSGKYS